MKYLFHILLIALVLISARQPAGEESHFTSEKVIYDVVFREKLAGSFEKTKVADHHFAYSYHFADRGRGPEISEEITLNDKNFIIAQQITGVNYSKSKVNETFSSKDNRASWKNSMEENEGVFDGNALYFRHTGSPAIYEILAQLLLRSETKSINLFPEGQTKLVQTYDFQLSDGTSLDLLMILGLGMNPSYIWMEGQELAAHISGNLHVVRDDFSAMRSEMKKLQDEVEDDYLIEIAKKVSIEMENVVIQNVNVFTEDGSILPAQDVLVRKNTISHIQPTGSLEIPSNTKIIDGSNKTLMPGMFDMHTHNSKFRGLLHLAGGVTSVRDLANNKQLKGLAKQFNDNEILGPQIVTFCGIIDGPGKYANQRNVVENLEEGLAEIQDYKDLGYQQIKIYSSIKPEWVLPLTTKSHELGMRVSGHIPAYMTATQAINQGYNEIQHINMLFLNFLSDTIDTRTPLRHTMPALHGAKLDLQSSEYLEFVELLKAKDILVDPTVALFENAYVAQKGEPSPTYAPVKDRLPLMDQRGFYSGGLEKNGDTIAIYKASFEKMLDVIHDLFKRGIAIVPGTDGLPGFLYHRELELYERSGITASEVLKLATIVSAEITGQSEVSGSIEEGKIADLILIDGNPVEDISDIRKVEWTMKGGYLYYAKDLYGAVGIKHFK